MNEAAAVAMLLRRALASLHAEHISEESKLSFYK
jgi:hypothetical protein